MSNEITMEQTVAPFFAKNAYHTAPVDPEDGPGDETEGGDDLGDDEFDDGDTSDGDPSEETYEEPADAGYSDA